MRVIAIYDFDGEEDNDLSFKTGEVIDVVEKDDSGWWVGNIGDQVGVFPSTRTKPYVKPVAMSGANLAMQRASGRGVRATSLDAAKAQLGEDENGTVHAIEAPATQDNVVVDATQAPCTSAPASDARRRTRRRHSRTRRSFPR